MSHLLYVRKEMGVFEIGQEKQKEARSRTTKQAAKQAANRTVWTNYNTSMGNV